VNILTSLKKKRIILLFHHNHFSRYYQPKSPLPLTSHSTLYTLLYPTGIMSKIHNLNAGISFTYRKLIVDVCKSKFNLFYLSDVWCILIICFAFNVVFER